MTTRQKALISIFKKKKGILRFSEIVQRGFHSTHLVALQELGLVEKIGRGLYKLTASEEFSNPDLVLATLKVPNSIVCLISALNFHEATEQIARQVDLAIPHGRRALKVTYPSVQFFRFSDQAWRTGIEVHKIDGHSVKIYSLAKTIADCFKFRNKIGGLSVAIEAMRVAVLEKKVKPAEIAKFAKICRVLNVVRPYFDAIL